MSAFDASDGPSAINALVKSASSGHAFDLVLLDVNMPAMDGFEVARQVSTSAALRGLGILMLSSSGDRVDRGRFESLGISGYLTKPVSASDLLNAIQSATVPPSTTKPEPARPAAGGLAKGAEIRPTEILLVEDNVVNQQVAMGLLTRRGHHVTLVQNGREAVDTLEHTAFDIVLMDLQMPVMGGLEATAAIRAREGASGTRQRIVAMTAHAMASDRELCLAAGMDGYMSKPIDPKKLFALVEESEAATAVETTPAVALPQPDVAAAFDREALLHRVSGDAELMNSTIEVFLEDLPIRMSTISSAVKGRDASAVAESAHALKGACANLSAGGMWRATVALEREAQASHLDALEPAWAHLAAQANILTATLQAGRIPVGGRPS
jgi:CheY-like chemotaxis protein/HPt (histidine-containing phosphotransfer) domain-containing protein